MQSTCCKYSLGADHLNDKLILFTVNQKHLKSIKRSLKLEQTKPKSWAHKHEQRDDKEVLINYARCKASNRQEAKQGAETEALASFTPLSAVLSVSRATRTISKAAFTVSLLFFHEQLLPFTKFRPICFAFIPPLQLQLSESEGQVRRSVPVQAPSSLSLSFRKDLRMGRDGSWPSAEPGGEIYSLFFF